MRVELQLAETWAAKARDCFANLDEASGIDVANAYWECAEALIDMVTTVEVSCLKNMSPNECRKLLGLPPYKEEKDED